MGNFVLQKGPCNFLKLHISPWGIPFLLLLCFSSPWYFLILYWRRCLLLFLCFAFLPATPFLFLTAATAAARAGAQAGAASGSSSGAGRAMAGAEARGSTGAGGAAWLERSGSARGAASSGPVWRGCRRASRSCGERAPERGARATAGVRDVCAGDADARQARRRANAGAAGGCGS
jgi:hypothetical protein